MKHLTIDIMIVVTLIIIAVVVFIIIIIIIIITNTIFLEPIYPNLFVNYIINWVI